MQLLLDKKTDASLSSIRPSIYIRRMQTMKKSHISYEGVRGVSNWPLDYFGQSLFGIFLGQDFSKSKAIHTGAS